MAPEQLISAIRAALDGGTQIDPAALREIVDAYEQAINDNRYGIAEVCDEYRCAILPALARGLGINPEGAAQ